MRKRAIAYTLLGHTDTVTSLSLSPDNTQLVSNSHDSTVRTWDIRPYAPADRRLLTYDGAPAGQDRNLLKASWDAKGERIAAGSGDQSVAIWEARTGKLLHKLPGHRGAVNDVRFHPKDEPLSKLTFFLNFPITAFRTSVNLVSVCWVGRRIFLDFFARAARMKNGEGGREFPRPLHKVLAASWWCDKMG